MNVVIHDTVNEIELMEMDTTAAREGSPEQVTVLTVTDHPPIRFKRRKTQHGEDP